MSTVTEIHDKQPTTCQSEKKKQHNFSLDPVNLYKIHTQYFSN